MKSHEEELCIICGTILSDLEDEDVIEIPQGKICIGCFTEGYFKKCADCGTYVFESRASYIEELDGYLCPKCVLKRLDFPLPYHQHLRRAS